MRSKGVKIYGWTPTFDEQGMYFCGSLRKYAESSSWNSPRCACSSSKTESSWISTMQKHAKTQWIYTRQTPKDTALYIYIQMQVSKNRSKHHIMCVSIYVCACAYTVYTSFVLLFSDFTSQKNDSSYRFFVHHVNKQSRLFRDENMNCHLFLRDEEP